MKERGKQGNDVRQKKERGKKERRIGVNEKRGSSANEKYESGSSLKTGLRAKCQPSL